MDSSLFTLAFGEFAPARQFENKFSLHSLTRKLHFSLTKYALPLLACLLCLACDDNTDLLGVEMMPTYDFTTSEYTTYEVETSSYEVGDSVLARSSVSYLGRFTDPETGTIIESDFLAQFHCSEGFAFPDSILDSLIYSTELRLYVEDFVGDSLATFKISVYPLNVILDPDANYYTNIDPTQYYDASQDPITTKWFTINDRTITDSARWDDDYMTSIRVKLPDSIGQRIYEGYLTNPEWFENTETFVNSGLPCSKGFYFKVENGDGAIAYIDVSQFNLYFDYYDEDLETDTAGVCQFAATEEVVQATRFENKRLDLLLENTDVTYLKSPAGIFTQAILPTDLINVEDTINQAALTLTRYNDLVDSDFKLSIPQTILLVRLDDYLSGFFEDYMVADSETSFLASFDSSSNTYEFSNISKLLTTIRREKEEGTATDNADIVLFIPVEATYDSSSNLVGLAHDFSMASAKLVGGENDRITLEVIYSVYNQ